MIWILGTLAVICITSWILGWYFFNLALEFVAFISGVTLFAVIVVWGITYAETSRDYAYMEEYLRNHDSSHAVSSAHFLELYTKYKSENRYWIGRQFNAKPPGVLLDLFSKDYKLQVVFE